VTDNDRTIVEVGDGVFEGILCKADTPNANGRVYPKEAVERMVGQLREMAGRGHGLVYGQESRFTPRLADVAARVVGVREEEGVVRLAAIPLLDMPKGVEFAEMAKSGLGFNLCAVGSVDANGVVRDAVFSHVSLCPADELLPESALPAEKG
jgi:hypothetical protein